MTHTEQKTRLLFVCTANMQRSPTAEKLFDASEQYEARSAGIHPGAPTPVTQELVDWADTIFVMSEREEGHESFIREHFSVGDTPIYDLGISDMYSTFSPELKHELKTKLAPFLDLDI